MPVFLSPYTNYSSNNWVSCNLFNPDTNSLESVPDSTALRLSPKRVPSLHVLLQAVGPRELIFLSQSCDKVGVSHHRPHSASIICYNGSHSSGQSLFTSTYLLIRIKVNRQVKGYIAHGLAGSQPQQFLSLQGTGYTTLLSPGCIHQLRGPPNPIVQRFL